MVLAQDDCLFRIEDTIRLKAFIDIVLGGLIDRSGNAHAFGRFRPYLLRDALLLLVLRYPKPGTSGYPRLSSSNQQAVVADKTANSGTAVFSGAAVSAGSTHAAHCHVESRHKGTPA